MSEQKPPSELAQIESELKGKTLQIYWYMLRSPGSHVGVREIQRTLHLSSPSVASHHLEKLVSLGLVDKTRTGEYYITQEIKVGLLRFFTRLGRFLVPRYLFYSVWFTTMLITYFAFYRPDWSIHNLVALIFGTLATVILWLETIRLWRQKPF
jgi:DNA-binding transcriptional ArsR family regulator